MTAFEPHPRTGQPVGLPVERTTPAPRPGPVTLKGRYGRLEKLARAHATPTCGRRSPGTIGVWTYIARDGPFADAAANSRFSGERAAAHRPLCLCDHRHAPTAPSAIVTLLRIVPEMRVIEVGHVLYSPALQRTPLGTETQYLLARYVFETLGYRRYEWKCDALNAASRRAALRYGFVYEGNVPPVHDRQGPQPRQRLVLHARQRMAGAQAQLRALARAGEFRQ